MKNIAILNLIAALLLCFSVENYAANSVNNTTALDIKKQKIKKGERQKKQ
ncbi:MAG: hypothetical protein ACI9XO_000332 [Paraglaciecola sp.]|jgi:hypothetical protein